MSEKETRVGVNHLEIRSEPENNEQFIEGYALKFDTWSEDLGGFLETIDRNALDETDMSDVRALFNHNADQVLARTTANTLTLTIDDTGLKFRARIPNTTYGNDLLENLRNGNVNQCSFGFMVADNGEEFRFDDQEDIYKRTIRNIERLVDVSVVTYPAYRDTDVAPALRSIDNIEKSKLKEREKEKLRLRLNLI